MMSKINQTDIDRLIELVGGRGNIATVSHCITRLRFVLNQPANARPKEIEQLPMVKGCFTNAGQFQVVIGTNVGDYYQALIASTGQAQVDKEQVKKAARHNMKWHEQLISHFAVIFFPLLPALISGGLILGFRNVIGDLPMSNGQTLAQMYPSLQTIYDFLWLIGEAIFFYLPVGICWSAVKNRQLEIFFMRKIMRYDNVKPCPFCGCPSVTVKAISGYYRAKCNGCESRTGYGGSEKEALERWNKRTTGNNNGGVHV